MNIHELCNVLANLNVSNDRMQLIIEYDLEKMADFYCKFHDSENLIIDPSPELDYFLDENMLDSIHNKLSTNQLGYEILERKVREKNGEIPDKMIIYALMDYYLDSLKIW